MAKIAKHKSLSFKFGIPKVVNDIIKELLDIFLNNFENESLCHFFKNNFIINLSHFLKQF